MTDPYKILGVSPNASEDQLKSAYRELAKKYHPDNYANNPLSDLAEEKMQEINEAYDQILAERKANGGVSGGYRGSYASAGESGSQFGDIRRLIKMGRVAEAQELLDGVASGSRDAEWNFLRGSVYYNRGWMDEALQSFQQAHSMSPQNQEYAAAYNQLLWQRQTGRSASYGQQGGYNQQQPMAGNCSCCDMCAALYCANCCTECFCSGCG